MVALVVRGFAADSVAAYRSRVDPAADAEELLSEMLFADLEQVGNRIEKLQGQLSKPANREATQRELDLMQRLQEALENEQPIREAVKSDAEAKAVRSFAFLSLKKHLAVVNCGEDDLDVEAEPIGDVQALRLSARIEEELAQLDPSDRAEFMADLGIGQSARDRLVRACYQGLDLVSMFTVGPDECRAWTLPAGTDAVTAAGEIHSDIARGFIRAETMAYDDLKAADGDEKAVKAAGKLRLEGKQYIVQDGDIINFRFNV
jgi:GTP-binding protein YchF